MHLTSFCYPVQLNDIKKHQKLPLWTASLPGNTVTLNKHRLAHLIHYLSISYSVHVIVSVRCLRLGLKTWNDLTRPKYLKNTGTHWFGRTSKSAGISKTKGSHWMELSFDRHSWKGLCIYLSLHQHPPFYGCMRRRRRKRRHEMKWWAAGRGSYPASQ